MADRAGQQLGNYRLIRLLGQGGFAEVSLGEHIHLSTQAAIKVLYARLAGNEVEMFRQEAHLGYKHYDVAGVEAISMTLLNSRAL
jgi:eukaryotic-like serine/threonine-protein kinase